MRHLKFIILTLSVLVFISCHSNQADHNGSDSSQMLPKDTIGQQLIPGTPGQSGTSPKPSDTTQAYRDSLTRERHLNDSSHAK